ncbi:MAG: hypothetical protein AAGF29_07565, partial [Pseudomonadota bacterium]
APVVVNLTDSTVTYGSGLFTVAANTIEHSGGNLDTLIGPNGVAEVVGRNGADWFFGSDRDESFVGLGGNDEIDGGGGFDRLRFDILGDVTGLDIAIDAGFAIGIYGVTSFSYDISNIEWITGSANRDEINGSAADERFDGEGGLDSIDSGGGNDVISVPDITFSSVDGGTGQDILELDGGNIHLDFFSGSPPMVTGFETIDLVADNGGAQLTITEVDVVNQSTEDNAEIAAAISGSSLDGATDLLLVNGDEQDILNLIQENNDGGSWNLVGGTNSPSLDGYELFAYTNSSGVIGVVAVDEDVQVQVNNIA